MNPETAAAPSYRGYVPLRFFLLRTPALPLELVAREHCDEFVEWRLDAGLLSDPISAWTESSERLAVIELSKPSFAETLRTFASAEAAKGRHLPKARGVETSARRFLLRASTRPTPRAVLASTQLGKIGASTALKALSLSELRPVVRISYSGLLAIGGKLGTEDAFLKRAHLFSNPTLRPTGSGYRYLERHTDGTREFSYAVAHVDGNQLIDTIVASTSRCVSWEALQSKLVSEGLEEDQASEIIREALRCQLIQSSLLPGILEQDTVSRWVAQLAAVREHPLLSAITSIATVSNSSDLGGVVESAAAANRLAGEVNVAASPSRIGEPVHVESVGDGGESVLSASLVPGLIEAIEAAASLSVTSALKRFESELAREISVKYGDTDIPLLELVDSWAGHADFADFADHPELVRIAGAFTEGARQSLSEPQQHLLTLAHSALADGSDTIDLGALNGLEVNAGRLPSGMCATAVLLDGRADGGERGLQWLFKSASRGVVSGFGRYAFASRSVLEAAREIAALEEAQFPGEIVADVEFVSGPTSANVSMRPQIYSRSISAPGTILSNEGGSIPLSDLVVRVKGERLELWSRSHGCRVRPRQASMQGFAPKRDLPLLVVLACLQSDGNLDYLGPEFLWGPLWSTLTVLPRITFKRVLLSRKYWNISKGEVPVVRRGDVSALGSILDRLGVPDCVAIVERDQELPVLTKSDWGLREIAQQLEREGRVRLTECVFSLQEPIRDSSGAPYAHEIVLPVLRQRAPAESLPESAPASVVATRRSHLPLNEWVYIKVYCSKPSQALLVGRVGPVLQRLCEEGLVSSWHFVRYSDYAPHLRIRCRVAQAGDEARVFGDIRDQLSQYSDVSTIPLEIGTYIPEVARYGGTLGMALAEECFFASSMTGYGVAQLVQGLSSTRDRLAVVTLSTLRHVIPLLSELSSLLEASEDAVRRYERTMGDEQRDVVKGTESALARAMRTTPQEAECLDLIRKLNERDYDSLASHCGATSREEVSRFLSSKEAQFRRTWIMDIIHMHLNRICGAGDRATEYLCFSIIARQIRTVHAMARTARA